MKFVHVGKDQVLPKGMTTHGCEEGFYFPFYIKEK